MNGRISLVAIVLLAVSCALGQSPPPDLPVSGPKNLPPIDRKKDEKIVNRPIPGRPTSRPTTRPGDLARGEEPQRPGPENTGVRDQKNLQRSGKIEAKDGQVIENLFVFGSIKVNGKKNVVIRNCVIDAGGAMYGINARDAENLLIERCEIYNVDFAAVYGDGFTIRSCQISQSKGDGLKPQENCVIEGNYFHTLGFNSPGAHADGIQISGGKNVKIIGNYFDMPINNPATKSNAGVFIHGNKGKRGSRDILVERNWFRGGNYTIHAYADGEDATTIRIVNNRFYPGEARYGLGKLQEGVEWTGNVFDGSGKPAAPQAK